MVALYKTAKPLERHLLEVDMQLTSVRCCLQSYQAYSRISSTWLRLHPPPTHTDIHPFYIKPIPPPHRLALPQLQDELEGHTPSLSQKKRKPKKKKEVSSREGENRKTQREEAEEEQRREDLSSVQLRLPPLLQLSTEESLLLVMHCHRPLA